MQTPHATPQLFTLYALAALHLNNMEIDHC